MPDAAEVIPNDSAISYDPIKPDHLNIIDLHVDPQLKPHHLLANRSSSWLSTDPLLEERRRQCIVQYLSEGDTVIRDVDCHPRGRYVSLDHLDCFRSLKVRCNSLDDVLLRCCEPRDIVCDLKGFGESQPVARDDDDDGGGPMSEIMGQLDFQVNQRNERSHFVLSELLIQTIEFIYSDELLRRSSSTFTFRGSTGILASLTESELLLNVTSVPPCPLSSPPSHSIVEPSSRADTMAGILLDDILYASPFVNVRDKFKAGAPSSFQRLIQRLQRNREFSSCEKQERLRPRKTDTPDGGLMEADPNYRSSESALSECVNEKMKEVLVETCSYPLNIPVGQYPELGPNQSLPTYVVTMSPTLSSQSTTLALQNNTCPGCQLEFSSDTARRLRLCRYYGFYFCSVCHSNTLMLIPARVLSNWDFTMLPVSCYARDLLKLVHSEPLFCLEHFSEKLRHSLPVLRSVLRLRLQGRLLLDFIETCRQGLSLKRVAMKFPSHWLSNSGPKFSLADFQLMESGLMVQELKEFATGCVEHISICPLCQAHGFLCELCRNKTDVIFPFEIDKVHQCAQCHACSHIRCYEKAKTQPCQKCERRKLRDEQLRKVTAMVTTLAAAD